MLAFRRLSFREQFQQVVSIRLRALKIQLLLHKLFVLMGRRFGLRHVVHALLAPHLRHYRNQLAQVLLEEGVLNCGMFG